MVCLHLEREDRIYSYEIIKYEISTAGMWNPNLRLRLIELNILTYSPSSIYVDQPEVVYDYSLLFGKIVFLEHFFLVDIIWTCINIKLTSHFSGKIGHSSYLFALWWNSSEFNVIVKTFDTRTINLACASLHNTPWNYTMCTNLSD